jgi:heterodisulfide reductase subunit C
MPNMDKLRISEIIEKESKQNVNLCYQCKKCTAGCPVVEEMDYTPTQIIHAVRLGMKDLVLNSKTIWLCASCETCSTRCPQEVDVSRVMDSLRILARREKIRPAVPEVSLFYNYVLICVRLFGCIYEVALGAMIKLKTKELLKELPLTLELFKRKKLRILPPFRDVFKVNRIFRKVKKLENM